MPSKHRKRFLHVCTACGKERWTTVQHSQSSLCRPCGVSAATQRTRLARWQASPETVYPQEIITRFWGKVDKESPCECHALEERCWQWTATLSSQGYGAFGYTDMEGTSVTVSAHRFAFQAEHGIRPTSSNILHRPPCVLSTCVRHLYERAPQQKYLHICTACGRERWGKEQSNPSGLCRPCFYAADIHKKSPPIIPPGSVYAKEDLARFWAKVNKETECLCHTWEERCWPWIAALSSSGYGCFSMQSPEGITYDIGAHRFAYQAEYGEIPSSVFVLHAPPCLLPNCVRHLYAGTPQQNANDRTLMGHTSCGEAHSQAKVTETIVRAIRMDYDAGKRIYELVIKYQQSESIIGNIARRRSWKHVS